MWRVGTHATWRARCCGVKVVVGSAGRTCGCGERHVTRAATVPSACAVACAEWSADATVAAVTVAARPNVTGAACRCRALTRHTRCAGVAVVVCRARAAQCAGARGANGRVRPNGARNACRIFPCVGVSCATRAPQLTALRRDGHSAGLVDKVAAPAPLGATGDAGGAHAAISPQVSDAGAAPHIPRMHCSACTVGAGATSGYDAAVQPNRDGGVPPGAPTGRRGEQVPADSPVRALPDLSKR